MVISPVSGARKPATRLSSVVLPQPDGPSSVISSPRRTDRLTASSAVTSPKRLVTPSSATATSDWSARLLNVQHPSETEENVGEDQQRRGGDDVHHRDRGHRGIGVFAHIVVERDRQRLGALGGDEQRGGEFVERQNGREQPAADQARQQQRQGDGHEHAVGRGAEARGGKLESLIE